MSFDSELIGGEDIDFNVASPESEKTASREVWLIEDIKPTADALIRVSSLNPDKSFKIVHYQEGEKAIEAFKLKVDQHLPLPVIILMDYQLDEGVQEPKYKTGAEVIPELKAIAAEGGAPMPDIVAFSTSDSSAQELIAAGAVSAVNKQRDGFGYISTLTVSNNEAKQ